MQERAPETRVWGALVLVQAWFGTIGVAGKIAFQDLAPSTLAAIRVATAALVLLVLARALRPAAMRALTRRDLLVFGGLGLFGVVVNQFLYLEGLSRTTAINAQLLMTTIPAFTALIAVVLRHERFSGPRMGGVGLSALGVAVLVGLDAIALGDRYLLGNLLVVLNAASYSLYLVLSRPVLQRHDALVVVAWSFALGAPLMGLLAGPTLVGLDLAAVGATTWLALAWIVAFPTVGTYTLNNWVLRRLDSSIVAAFIPLQPLVATLLAVPILGEALHGRTLVAGALIVTGVLLAARAPHPGPPAPRARAPVPRRGN